MAEEEQIKDDQQNGSDELYERFVIKIDKGQEPLRIDKYLMNRIEGATRNKIQQAINAMVTVNKNTVKQNYKIKGLDEIIVYSDMSPEETEVVPEKIDLNIVYEDDEIMIINKPAGMVVHPGKRKLYRHFIKWSCLVSATKKSCDQRRTLPRFGLVHRIDKNTSGLLVLAKNDKAMTPSCQTIF